MRELLLKRLHPAAKLPTRATGGSAGFDLYACLPEPLTIPGGGRAVIPTGLAAALPDRQTVGLVYARSGLSVGHGLTLANGVGVIDSDYRGEILVALVNLSDAAYTLQPGERMAQLVITPVLLPDIREAAELPDTERGGGGFGSSGR